MFPVKYMRYRWNFIHAMCFYFISFFLYIRPPIMDPFLFYWFYYGSWHCIELPPVVLGKHSLFFFFSFSTTAGIHRYRPCAHSYSVSISYITAMTPRKSIRGPENCAGLQTVGDSMKSNYESMKLSAYSTRSQH